MFTRKPWFIFVGIALAAGWLSLCRAEKPATSGQPPSWNGFERLDFEVAGRPCILVRPEKPAPGNPWIWRTEFFGVEPQGDVALLAHGWHVAYMNAKNMYGAPKAMALFDQFYRHITDHYALNRRVVLEGFSRGGLYAFNFAATYPERTAALYLDAPVLDIRSWPGGAAKKHVPGAEELWRSCLEAYGLTEATVAEFKGNPLDRIDPLAKAGIPIIVVCGDADDVVPMAENSALLVRHYRERGGRIEWIIKPGVSHHPHSLPDPAPIVSFLQEQALQDPALPAARD